MFNESSRKFINTSQLGNLFSNVPTFEMSEIPSHPGLFKFNESFANCKMLECLAS